MKCIEAGLGALIDGEVNRAQAEIIESHLKGCRLCRTEFEYLHSIRGFARQTPAIAPPKRLDEKVIFSFHAFHDLKRNKTMPEESPKTGWFGIPRFAFGAALALFVLTAISAFQLGKISALENRVGTRQASERESLAESNVAESIPVKIVEVPVIQEKIVRVPVITEKIVTKTIYVERKKGSSVPKTDNFAIKSTVENNGYLTTTNLKGFQPVSDFKVIINKKEKENEK